MIRNTRETHPPMRATGALDDREHRQPVPHPLHPRWVVVSSSFSLVLPTLPVPLPCLLRKWLPILVLPLLPKLVLSAQPGRLMLPQKNAKLLPALRRTVKPLRNVFRTQCHATLPAKRLNEVLLLLHGRRPKLLLRRLPLDLRVSLMLHQQPPQTLDRRLASPMLLVRRRMHQTSRLKRRRSCPWTRLLSKSQK